MLYPCQRQRIFRRSWYARGANTDFGGNTAKFDFVLPFTLKKLNDEHERDPSAASTHQQRDVFFGLGRGTINRVATTISFAM